MIVSDYIVGLTRAKAGRYQNMERQYDGALWIAGLLPPDPTTTRTLFSNVGYSRLESRGADRAGHYGFTDHITRRAIDADGAGELPRLLDGLVDFGAADITLEPVHVCAGLLRRGKRIVAIDRAATAEKRLMKGQILLAGVVLHAQRDADARGFRGARTENGQFLQDDFQLLTSSKRFPTPLTRNAYSSSNTFIAARPGKSPDSAISVRCPWQNARFIFHDWPRQHRN